MDVLGVLRKQFRGLGYASDAILPDYTFADVMATGGEERSVSLAAFSHTPPSYRTAAFGVLAGPRQYQPEELMDYRALGAPILFCITGQVVQVWQVRSAEKPRKIDERSVVLLQELFRKYARDWTPDSIRRAKSIGLFDVRCQLDFVDIGLMPAIEGEIQIKLDRLINEILDSAASRTRRLPKQERVDAKTLFRLTFRLLAAKILHDRKHPHASAWQTRVVRNVLEGISGYYNLGRHDGLDRALITGVADDAWNRLLRAINFSNISGEDLAFVYETTLVSKETRTIFSTHSTPRQVAEYIVSNLRFDKIEPDRINVYEPFVGAGVLLVSALRHIRDVLPTSWDERRRHDYFIRHLSGSDVDAFACEVAGLSLILADYPNANGWRIHAEDLFQGETLANRLRTASVVLCNPPFEDFRKEERAAYPGLSHRSPHKPTAVLETVLDLRPKLLGFVLPSGFIFGRHYDGLRRKLEETYSDIEVVSLPDRVFRESKVESALLIAQDRRDKPGGGTTRLVSTRIDDRDRQAFLLVGKPSSRQSLTRPVEETTLGRLWPGDLFEVWQYLNEAPILGTVAEIHRGLEWNYGQHLAFATEAREGYRRGLHTVGDVLSQFQVRERKVVFLDCKPESQRTNSINYPWHEPKVIANAARISRGPWRIAATPDRAGLVCSQQFFGVWPRGQQVGIEVLAAILNSPLVNAFLSVHDPNTRVRVGTLEHLPLPVNLDQGKIVSLVASYRDLLEESAQLLSPDRDGDLAGLLLAIDAEVLRGYDLPPRLERTLLDYFRGEKRPSQPPVSEYFPADFTAWIPLHEYLSDDLRRLRGDWIRKVFKHIEGPEAKLIGGYLR